MKSAYELAMERLNRSAPAAPPLSAQQKERLAETDRIYQGKIAERAIFLQEKIATALSTGDLAAVEELEKQKASERLRLEEEREVEKERIRRSS